MNEDFNSIDQEDTIRVSAFPAEFDVPLDENINYEYSTVIWLDADINRTIDCIDTETRLRSIINFLKIFTDLSVCIEYIKSVTNEDIFLIISGSYGIQVIPTVHNIPSIAFIYVFCSNEEIHNSWITMYTKISGVFVDKSVLCKKLREDMVAHATNMMDASLLYVTTDEQSTRDLTGSTDATLMWYELFMKILLEMPLNGTEKAQMIKECKLYYKNNSVEQKKINDFEINYCPEQAISWYTRDSFIYRLINKALRTENIAVIYKFTFFIRDLYNQLHQVYEKSFEFTKKTTTVYRGQFISDNELTKLKKNIGGCLFVNTFVSTTLSSEVAFIFAGNSSTQPGLASVVFQIEIDNEALPGWTMYTPFGNIEKLSYVKAEREVMFSIGTIFKIKSIELIGNIWLIELELQYFQQRKYSIERLLSDTKCYVFDTNDTEKARELYLKLLKIYIEIGLSNRETVDYDLSIDDYIKTLNVISKNQSTKQLILALMHISMGDGIMVTNSKTTFALKHYQKALEIELNFLPTYYELISDTYTAIGTIHEFSVQPDKTAALDAYVKSLETRLNNFAVLKTDNYEYHILQIDKTFERIAVLCEEKSICVLPLETYEQQIEIFIKSFEGYTTIFHSMGQLHVIAESYTNAINLFKKRLKYELETDQIFDIARTYMSLGNVYERTNHYLFALYNYIKAFEVDLDSLTNNYYQLTVEDYNYIIQNLCLLQKDDKNLNWEEFSIKLNEYVATKSVILLDRRGLLMFQRFIDKLYFYYYFQCNDSTSREKQILDWLDCAVSELNRLKNYNETSENLIDVLNEYLRGEFNYTDYDCTTKTMENVPMYKEILKELERALKQFVKSYELSYKYYDNGLYPPPDYTQVPILHENHNILLNVNQSIARMVKQICDYVL